jgi:hypothetical protein
MTTNAQFHGVVLVFRGATATAKFPGGLAQEVRNHLIEGSLPHVAPYGYWVASKRVAEDATPGTAAWAYSISHKGAIAKGTVHESGRPFTPSEDSKWRFSTPPGRSVGVIFVEWRERFVQDPIPIQVLRVASGLTMGQWQSYARSGIVPLD